MGAVKPEKEIYDLCLRQLDVRPSDAVYVGDGGSSELAGAKAVGLTTVMMIGVVKDVWANLIPARRAHADFVIEQLSELVGEQDDHSPAGR